MQWLRDDEKRESKLALQPCTNSADTTSSTSKGNNGSAFLKCILARANYVLSYLDPSVSSWILSEAQRIAEQEAQTLLLERRARLEAKAVKIKRIREEKDHAVLPRYRKHAVRIFDYLE